MAKVEAVDSTKRAQELKKIEKEEKAQKAEEKKKADEAKKQEKSDAVAFKNSGMSDYRIKAFVKEYIERLIKKHGEEEDIITRLRSYLGNFNVDKFREEYPELKNNTDLSTAMYNESFKHQLTY